MTKYEWETELKRNIHSLPADEIKRVLEYYGELFDEMAERGKSEREIINEFGNPFDVANKILSEYDGEPEPIATASNPTIEPSVRQDVTEQQSKQDGRQREDAKPDADASNTEPAAKSITVQRVESGRRADFARIALFILFNVFTGGIMFIAIVTVWIILAALVISGAGVVLGGGAAVISSFAVMSTGHAGAGISQLGLSIAAVGIGILLVVGCVLLIMLYWKLNKLIFGGIKKLLTVKAV